MENTATPANETDTPMTPKEAKDIDDLIKLAESQPAYLSHEEMHKIENWVEETGRVRRLTLATLTRPFIEMQEDIAEDRKTAEALAELHVCQEDLILGLKALLECAEKSSLRLRLALTIRDDYEELMELAKSSD